AMTQAIDALLTTKLNPPQVRVNLVARPRLTKRLDRSLQTKLTLLSAPAGYGKTTLLSAWIEETHPRLGWVSLDRRDNDPTRFWAYLIAAVESVHSDIGNSALSQLQSPQQPDIESVLSALINPISDIPDSLVIVLDDYHVIEANAIHDGLAFLIEHMPSQMHLLVSTRADPALPIAALRVKDELNELRAEDLRATREESGIFLEKVMGLDLSRSDVVTLENRTEGWIAGLQLAGLSMRGRDDISEFLEAFAGSHRYVLDYLTEEVLDRQLEEDQSFLLQTSILERLSGSLCDAVTGHHNGQATLEQFEAANLFIIPLDDKRHWYRYHHLFADILRNQLGQQRPDKVPELHLRACDWYEQHGFVAEALDHALTAQDYERAAGLAERTAGQKIMSGELTTVRHWLEKLPDRVLLNRPRLILDQAWMLLWTGQREAAEERLNALINRERAASAEFAGEVFAIRASIAYYKREMQRALELAQAALEELPEEELFLRSIMALAQGHASLWKGDLRAADRGYAESQSISQIARTPIIGLLALAFRIHLQQISGRLRQAEKLFKEAVRLADEYNVRSLPAVGAALVRMGDVHREWNEFEVATKSLTEGLALCERRGGMVDHTIDGYISLARVRQSQMDFDGAREMLARAQRVGGEFDVPNLSSRLNTWRVRVHVAEGDLEVDEPWADTLLSETQVIQGQEPRHVYEAQQTTLARWLLSNNQPAEALAILESMLEEAQVADRKATILEVLTLQSLALRKQSKSREAIVTLKKALKLAEPEGYVRMFVDEGESMEILLRGAASEGIALDYVRTLLEVYEAPSPMPQGLAPGVEPLAEPLTPRELQVLRLMAAGLKNREVAEELVVALGTVKTHINGIYGKLEVNNRVKALSRARELGLL
ncbi:MAG: LuxR C-terminal-related transcriptional regulator, partial [Anaerolineales bacterium]